MCLQILPAERSLPAHQQVEGEIRLHRQPASWKDMTVEQAQEVESNMAEWEFPRLFQFAWISDFLRVCTALSSNAISTLTVLVDVDRPLCSARASLILDIVSIV